jgi:drug/metabolite transporter (DMT)-like permease
MAANLWFFYALSTSVLWGLGYVLAEKILKLGVPPSVFMLTQALICLPLYGILISLRPGQLKSGIDLFSLNKATLLLMLLNGVCVIGGQLLILTSIAAKNATLASMVEITYPIFVALFSLLIFKESHLSWSTALGGLLILSGVGLIYLKN